MQDGWITQKLRVTQDTVDIPLCCLVQVISEGEYFLTRLEECFSTDSKDCSFVVGNECTTSSCALKNLACNSQPFNKIQSDWEVEKITPFLIH